MVRQPTRDAAASEGWPQVNEHGVFEREQCEALRLGQEGEGRRGIGEISGSEAAKILLVQDGPDSWRMAACFQFHQGDHRGRSSLPWARGPEYATREAAVRAGAEELLEAALGVLEAREREVLQEWRSEHPTVTVGEAREAIRLAAWARELLDGVEGQMDLFLGSGRA